jgi:hypothetical protein
VSELKCCKICGAFYTCTNKGECCPECEHFDPLDNLCMAGHLKKKAAKTRARKEEDVDPETFLFEDDDDDLDESDLPPERDVVDSANDFEDDLDEWD